MISKSQYKNTSGEDLTIPDFGLVKSGETIELPDNFHNVNFKKIGREKVETKLKDNKDEESK